MSRKADQVEALLRNAGGFRDRERPERREAPERFAPTFSERHEDPERRESAEPPEAEGAGRDRFFSMFHPNRPAPAAEPDPEPELDESGDQEW